jgi:predicted dehydrogenase
MTGAAERMDSRLKARIGIIGAGYWAVNFYLPFLQAHEKASCIGVVRPGERALQALRTEFGLEVASESVEELLMAHCDGVIVSSPHFLHADHAIQALRSGAHVLVEKPLALSTKEAVAIQAAVEQTGMSLTVAHGFNYLPMSTWALDVVQSGRLGEPSFLTGYMASALEATFAGDSSYGRAEIDGVTFETESTTWADPQRGGGYLYGQLCHLLGLSLAFVDRLPAEVFARTRRLSNDVDIDVSASVSFDGGGVGSFTGSGRLPWGVRYPLDLRVVAEKGILSLDFDRERAEVHIGPSAMPLQYESAGEQAFAGRPADLVFDARPGDGLYTCAGPVEFLIGRCLGDDPVNRAPIELGVRTTAILEAAAESGRSGGPVRVSLGRTQVTDQDHDSVV